MANNAISHTIQSQLNEIWLTVQLKSVWRPMLFVYTFNLFQVPNVAWQSYLQVWLYIYTIYDIDCDDDHDGGDDNDDISYDNDHGDDKDQSSWW